MKESSARTRILDVASRLFYEQGYNSTGINQIIEEAEIARGSLYNHFPSKRDLLTAYIQQAEDRWFAELDKFLATLKDPRQKLLGLFDFRIERQLRSNFGGCLFSKIGAEVPKDDLNAFELVYHQKERFKIYITELLQQMKLSEPQALSQEMLANALFMIFEGATAIASISKSDQAIRDAKKIAESLI
ncbi:TetR/AcrR family transcriptional regulator [Pedobacter metabolipauper]|uniref:TetR family transcriptional regulator n=1 Tax=Pedobacter metabolipauper TaxID=425513 RepID=A0A4R6SVV0_9SPHI|nr:TetR/AcrR family transcriptional regulator [Pedobacter metabolipauper]TDQ08242.1 TetR family transcriptional regulator [Pedobacter metabolipauper]